MQKFIFKLIWSQVLDAIQIKNVLFYTDYNYKSSIYKSVNSTKLYQTHSSK